MRDEATAEAVAQMAIAHELAHALQDQEVGLHKFFAAAGAPNAASESGPARAAISEGHACWIAERAADRLGIGQHKPLMRTLLPGGGALGDKAETLPPTVAAKRRVDQRTYLGGLAFFDHHCADGGDVGCAWRFFSQPPANLAQIDAPASYDPAHKPRPDSLEAIERHLGELVDGKKWTASGGSRPGADFAAFFRSVGPDVPKAIERCVASMSMREASIDRPEGARRLIAFRTDLKPDVTAEDRKLVTTAFRTKLVGQFDDMTSMGTPTKSMRNLRLDPPGIDVDVHEATIVFEDNSNMTVLLVIADHGSAAMNATLVNVAATDAQIEAMVRQALGVGK